MRQNRKIEPPFFEIGPKCYIYGRDILKLAQTADRASEEHKVDVIFTAPFLQISEVAANTNNLFVFAPHMDPLHPGRGIANILPEALIYAGVEGVMLNHCEKQIAYGILEKTVGRAKELNLLTAICADSVAESKAVALLSPDVIVAEPSDLIGTEKTSDLSYIRESTKAIKAIDPDILVLQAAGVKTPQDAYRNIYAGADATGTTSGVVCADDPAAMLENMIRAVRDAYEKRQKKAR